MKGETGMIIKLYCDRFMQIRLPVIMGLLVMIVSSCTDSNVVREKEYASTGNNVVKEKEYTSEGNLSYKSTSVDAQVISELRRVFENKSIEGIGIFESDNEGLARRTATNLALVELAGQVQTLVRSESVVYNNKDVREVVDNRVNALVNNYRIESVGYDPGTYKYRVRVVLNGESLAREIEKYVR
jgi:hypothetical protein